MPSVLDHIRVFNDGVDVSLLTTTKYELNSEVDMDSPISDHLSLEASITLL